MYFICKQFTFSASHQLDHLPEDHKCARLHGHNYTAELVLAASSLNEYDFVVDYGDLELFRKFIDERLDHRHLNDVVPYRTTAENIAKWLFEVACSLFPQTVAVRVSETPKTWAEWNIGDTFPEPNNEANDSDFRDIRSNHSR
jgi:6-pyruvoyltetrahydropterin/6-carboxytetrahydropterin synthase